ncbi:hypothetical protein [Citrobacter europaeus]|uniref:hypothetical protein n=1 Tax=Citrobacter europaeus TaxID=1914243 RepID=UPI00397C7645
MSKLTYEELAVQLANAESKCRELAAECSEVKVAAILLADEAAQIYKRWNLTQQPDGDIVDMQTMQEMLCACHETPATDAFLAEVRAQAHSEGINFAASRLATAFNHGFVDKPMAEVDDVVRMILDAKDELTGVTIPAPDGLSGDYHITRIIEPEYLLLVDVGDIV